MVQKYLLEPSLNCKRSVVTTSERCARPRSPPRRSLDCHSLAYFSCNALIIKFLFRHLTNSIQQLVSLHNETNQQLNRSNFVDISLCWRWLSLNECIKKWLWYWQRACRVFFIHHADNFNKRICIKHLVDKEMWQKRVRNLFMWFSWNLENGSHTVFSPPLPPCIRFPP